MKVKSSQFEQMVREDPGSFCSAEVAVRPLLYTRAELLKKVQPLWNVPAPY